MSPPYSPLRLCRLTVLAMAGVAAEVLACGSAEGGHADVAQLKGMLAIASPPVTEACAVDDRIRWATLMALTMLQNHRPCLEALAERLEVAQDAGECIRLLEATARAPPPRGVESSD